MINTMICKLIIIISMIIVLNINININFFKQNERMNFNSNLLERLIEKSKSTLVNDLFNKNKQSQIVFGKEIEEFKLSIKCDKNVFFIGEPIHLNISFKNTTENKLILQKKFSPENDYEIIIKNKAGKNVLRLENENNEKASEAISHPFELGAKAISVDSIGVNYLYNMTEPGLYFITVKRKVDSLQKRRIVEVVSNTIQVNILKRPKTNKTWGSISEGFQLSIQSNKDHFTIGEMIIIKINLRNSIRKVLNLSQRYAEKDYELIVEKSDGKTVKLTESGKQFIKGTPRDKFITMTIAPGEEIQDHIVLNKLYDLSEIGEYFITIKRRTWKLKERGSSEINSNTIKVVVGK